MTTDSAVTLTTAAAMVRAYLESDVPTFVWGPPGVGKSDSVRMVARDMGIPVIDVRAILLDPVDLRGLPHVADGLAHWALPSFLPREERDGPRGILFLDELNAAPPSTQAACFGLVLDRRLGDYQMPAGWRIVAAGNRQSDRAAAQRMPSALANRFAHIDVTHDIESWKRWANGAAINPVVVAFLSFRPELLHKMDGNASDLRAFPTPRSWAQVAKVADAPDSIRQSLVAGLVGAGAAAEFEGFVRTFRNLPRLADILADPAGAMVPSDPAALYAVSTGLGRVATAANMGAVVTYAGRLPREFDVLTVVDAVRRDSSLAETAGFVVWATRNQGVTI
jgi:hypothetical protein